MLAFGKMVRVQDLMASNRVSPCLLKCLPVDLRFIGTDLCRGLVVVMACLPAVVPITMEYATTLRNFALCGSGQNASDVTIA